MFIIILFLDLFDILGFIQ